MPIPASGTFSWKEKIAAGKDSAVLLLQSHFPDGREAFFCIRCTLAKAQALKAELPEGRELNLEAYGLILHSGWGRPEQKDLDVLREKYGIVFDAEG